MSSSSSHRPRGDSDVPSLARGGPSWGSSLALVGVHTEQVTIGGDPHRKTERIVRVRTNKKNGIQTNADKLRNRMGERRHVGRAPGELERSLAP